MKYLKWTGGTDNAFLHCRLIDLTTTCTTDWLSPSYHCCLHACSSRRRCPTSGCLSAVSWAWLITLHHCVGGVFFSCASFDFWGRRWLTTLLRHSYTHSSAADSTTATVCCIASVVGCWGSCRRCRTLRHVLWRGQESSTTSCQCWTNSIGCPWYSVCGSSWWCRWLFSSASMAWHRPTSPTTASLCRPWLVDVRCGPPTPEPCTFHGLVLPSAPGTLQWLAHVYGTVCRLNCECWTVLSAPLRRN